MVILSYTIFILYDTNKSYIESSHQKDYEIQALQKRMDKLKIVVDNHHRSIQRLEDSVSRGGTREQEYRGIATAYTHTGNNTRTGIYPVAGVTIAVDPRVIPLGSEIDLEFPEYPSLNGRYIAQDTGGAIKGTKIDVFMDTRSECVNFGIKEVNIKLREK